MQKSEPMIGAVDQAAFEQVMRDNLSPEALATIVSLLQPAAFAKPDNPAAMQALSQVEWFSDMLTAMLGADELQRIFDDLCL